MSVFTFIGLVLLTAGLVGGMTWLFVRRGYRAGPTNNWTQRNDLRKEEARGPDNDFVTLAIGSESLGGAAE